MKNKTKRMIPNNINFVINKRFYPIFKKQKHIMGNGVMSILNYRNNITSYINRCYYSIFINLGQGNKIFQSTHVIVIKRNMHRIGSMTAKNSELIKDIGKTSLETLNIITNDNVINNLINNNPKPLVTKTLDYMHTNQDSSVQMKNNFFSGLIKTPIDLKDVSSVYKDLYPQSKLHIIDNGHVYSRVIGEIPIAHNFTNRFESYLDSTIFTGDTLITGRKGQSNPDLIQRLLSLKEIENDIKAGNTMSRHPLKGTIGQLMYNVDTQICLPNDPVDLIAFSKKRLDEFGYFNADLRDSKCKMVSKEEQEYRDYLREIEFITKNINIDLITKHIKIEKILMRIQSIPSMPKRPSYINTIQLEKGRVLNSKELEFLEGIIPYVNKDIFKNQNHFNMYIRRVLRVYNNTVDNQAIKRVKELKGTIWEHTYLDRIDTDIF